MKRNFADECIVHAKRNFGRPVAAIMAEFPIVYTLYFTEDRDLIITPIKGGYREAPPAHARWTAIRVLEYDDIGLILFSYGDGTIEVEPRTIQ